MDLVTEKCNLGRPVVRRPLMVRKLPQDKPHLADGLLMMKLQSMVLYTIDEKAFGSVAVYTRVVEF